MGGTSHTGLTAESLVPLHLAKGVIETVSLIWARKIPDLGGQIPHGRTQAIAGCREISTTQSPLQSHLPSTTEPHQFRAAVAKKYLSQTNQETHTHPIVQGISTLDEFHFAGK